MRTSPRGGVMNEGETATRLGLPGIPREAETIMLDRDIRIARLTGGRYHAAQISCAAGGRRAAPRQARRQRRHRRRGDRASGAERERRRRLPHLLQDVAAAPLRGRPPGAGRGARRRHDRRRLLGARPAGRRGQAPAFRRGRRRRGRARDDARGRAAARPFRRRLAAPPDRGDEHRARQSCSASRPGRSRPARRPT